MKITLFLLSVLILVVSCEKDGNEPINEELHDISHHAVVTATLTDSLTGLTITGYDVYSLNQNQVISTHQLTDGMFSIYCFWITPQPNSINFAVIDSNGIIVRQYIQPVELIENDTIEVDLLF